MVLLLPWPLAIGFVPESRACVAFRSRSLYGRLAFMGEYEGPREKNQNSKTKKFQIEPTNKNSK